AIDGAPRARRDGGLRLRRTRGNAGEGDQREEQGGLARKGGQGDVPKRYIEGLVRRNIVLQSTMDMPWQSRLCRAQNGVNIFGIATEEIDRSSGRLLAGNYSGRLALVAFSSAFSFSGDVNWLNMSLNLAGTAVGSNPTAGSMRQ